jgi:hypothetical protein
MYVTRNCVAVFAVTVNPFGTRANNVVAASAMHRTMIFAMFDLTHQVMDIVCRSQAEFTAKKNASPSGGNEMARHAA